MRRVLGLVRVLAGRHRRRDCLTLGALAAIVVAGTLGLVAGRGWASQAQEAMLEPADLTLGGAVLWLFLGTPVGAFLVRWVAPVLVAVAAGLSRADDAAGTLAEVLVGDRRRWWAACLVESWASVARAFAVLLALMAVGVALAGGSVTLAPGAADTLCAHAIVVRGVGAADVSCFMGLVLLGCLALDTLQLAVGLALGPLAGFGVAALVVTLSCCTVSPWLLGSGLMSCRVLPFAGQAASLRLGMGQAAGTSLAALVTCAFLGRAIAGRLDLLGRGRGR